MIRLSLIRHTDINADEDRIFKVKASPVFGGVFCLNNIDTKGKK